MADSAVLMPLRIPADTPLATELEQWLQHAVPAECPLFPSRDVLRHDEEHTSKAIRVSPVLTWAYPKLVVQQRRKQSSKRTEDVI